MKTSKYLLLLFLIIYIGSTSFSSLFAQNIVLKGVVTDSTYKPLEFANVIAKPYDKNINLSFSLTDNKGNYNLKLVKNKSYSIEVSYLGYSPIIFLLDSTFQSKSKNFILRTSSNELEEIVVVYKLPVGYNNDTLIYETDVFVNGSERKLKEVLKKLPGVEVDREGNITVHGKKIDKILVEGETFFNGGSKLAVENIPADAVNTVEVIDNYNEIEFLSEVSESDELAMNITLKKDKKNFLFGDINVGGGIENRYLLHPSLFYYSPKSNFNFIGDINNVGEKIFTLKDFISFGGGLGKLITNPTSFIQNSTGELFSFFETQDVKSNNNIFSGLSFKRNINSKLDLNSYFIFSKNNTLQEEVRQNQYLSDSLTTLENRILNDELKNNLGILKFSLDYVPKKNVDVSYNVSLKKSINKNKSNYLSSTLDRQSFIDIENQFENISFLQNYEYHQKKSKKYSNSFILNHHLKNENGEKNWFTDNEGVAFILPLQDSILFDIFQNKNVNRHHVDGLWKHYFILNKNRHIYFTVGNNFYNQKYITTETQETANGEIIDFHDEGFGNDVNFRLNDFFLQLDYKFKYGITTTKVGLTPHFYFWKIKQSETFEKSKMVLSPNLKSEIKFSKSEKLEFNYRLVSNFSDVSFFSSRFFLRNFNSLFLGNPNLENEISHQTSLYYKKYNWFSNFDFNTYLSFVNKTKRVRNENLNFGIVQISIPSLVSTPRRNLVWRTKFRKGIKKVSFTLKSNISISQFYQSINSQEFKTRRNTNTLGISFETNFKKHPNIEIGFDQTFQNYNTELSNSKFKKSELFIGVNHTFWNDFIFSFDYEGTDFSNDSGSQSKYGIGNTTLFYQKENSPLGFEIKVLNIFNAKEKRQATFSDSIISDFSTVILPRIFLFSISYKL